MKRRFLAIKTSFPYTPDHPRVVIMTKEEKMKINDYHRDIVARYYKRLIDQFGLKATNVSKIDKPYPVAPR